ncbi:thrombospondin type 3 repeat-containing protein, partial [Streptococcus sp. HMSC071D03]
VPVTVKVVDPSTPEDPSTKDSDGDGLTDKEEAEKGTDPKDPKSKPESKPEDPSTKDTDADKNTPKAKDQTVKPG